MRFIDRYGGGWPRYVPVAERRLAARREAMRLQKKGRRLSPVALEGSRISVSWWGQAWCSNLESYSDFSNRMPRGRSYVKSGCVVDLQIERGRIRALVVGKRLYEIDVCIKPLGKPRWRKVVASCAGKIGSMVELLQGR